MQSPAPSLSILALNYEYPPVGGGGATAHEALLRELTRDGTCRVLLITTALRKNVEEQRANQFLTIRRVPVGKRDLRYWRRSEVVRYLWGAYREARCALQRDSFDVCHAFFGIPAGLVAYRLRDKIPYVLSLRGSDVPGFNRRFSWDHRVLRPIVRRSWMSAWTIVANSEDLRDQAAAAFDGITIQVIPNGVDTVTFQPKPHLPGHRPLLVTVARLIPRKGLDLLLESLPAVVSRPWKLMIIGDGPERSNLAALTRRLGLADRVEFSGDLDRNRIARLLPDCDLFVLPSLAEGMSNATLEAMACGLPVLLTDTGGARELVHGNGLVVPCGKVDRLSAALADLLDRVQEWPQLGAKSRQIAESYSWSTVAERYRSLFLEAAGKG